MHFTSTSASWLNRVERSFWEITPRVIRPGSFRSVPELVGQTYRFRHQHSLQSMRFQWTADHAAMLHKIHRAWESLLESIYNPTYATMR